MKKIVMILSIGMIFCVASVASAIPTTWTDTVDWNPDVYLSDAPFLCELYDGLGYHHSIADDGFKSTWMGGDDTISSFSLTIRLYDDKDKSAYSFESADIYVPIFRNLGSYDFNLDSDTFGGTISGKYDLMLDGTLNVFIEPVFGDFYADWSKLTVHGDDGTAPVPEPATMLLLGTGLLAVAGTSRKKRLGKK